MKHSTRLLIFALLALLISGCVMYASQHMDDQFGTSHPQNRMTNKDLEVDYFTDVKPILEKRCIICHGCYDAPCQLRMEAMEGIDRGANKEKVYDGRRLFKADLTRLFEDAQSTQQWRSKSFYPVLNERNQTTEANVAGSLIARLLILKQENPLTQVDQLTDHFDFSIKRDQQCPTIENFDHYTKKYAQWGMPFGLPAVKSDEHELLMEWIKNGAKYKNLPALPDKLLQKINKWEAFLNGSSLKQQLVSRYIYEHLFISNVYFSDSSERQFFRLVRSTTAPGSDINLIATRHPYNDPATDRVYYRLQTVNSTILDKTHIPYALNDKRLQRYKELFLQPDYIVKALPSYDRAQSANPFITFRDIPAKSRYRFLLDEARSTIMGFIKGPVCRGQVALDVINDHFWVMFINPDSELVKHDAEFLALELNDLRLPNEQPGKDLALSSWLKFSKLHRNYLLSRKSYLKKELPDAEDISLDLVWDGDGTNKNAALTIFRHFDSGSVVQGLVGQEPKTAWLIDFPLLERIHYLLVAGFDVYGNLGHQLNSRLYMDFFRMEGEYNFLTLLPQEFRKQELHYWYRGKAEHVDDYINWTQDTFNVQSGIKYETDNPKLELFQQLKDRLQPVLNQSYAVKGFNDQQVSGNLNLLSNLVGGGISFLPQISFLSITDTDQGDVTFTIINNSAHSNVNHLFSEDKERLKDEDTVTVVKGFLGSYPNAFYKVPKDQLTDFVSQIAKLTSENDYDDLMDNFGVRRTNPDIWTHSDSLHAEYKNIQPIEAALFDFNRLENR